MRRSPGLGVGGFQQGKGKVMRKFAAFIVAAALLVGFASPARAQNLGPLAEVIIVTTIGVALIKGTRGGSRFEAAAGDPAEVKGHALAHAAHRTVGLLDAGVPAVHAAPTVGLATHAAVAALATGAQPSGGSRAVVSRVGSRGIVPRGPGPGGSRGIGSRGPGPGGGRFRVRPR